MSRAAMAWPPWTRRHGRAGTRAAAAEAEREGTAAAETAKEGTAVVEKAEAPTLAAVRRGRSFLCPPACGVALSRSSLQQRPRRVPWTLASSSWTASLAALVPLV
mmetsp:Transcript_107730/g.301004  ORF Transcript_107730/g.301004 Transcript_107730/m.301004 type:complete len:105 (+) Transcript_107730:1358-1672(+)